ncbi:MAG: hypothetical protein QM697_00220 [Lachnospiraceae bacterium]
MKLFSDTDHTAQLQKGLEYVILFLVSIVFLLAFSLWTSPFYHFWYGCDASFFSMVGRGITQGLVPYRDFFDLKGPYFFFIEALGQFLHKDRLGVFFIQIPFLFFSLLLISRLAGLYLNKKKSAAVLLIFLFVHISTLWGGNTLEEFCLPLNLLCLYLVAKHLKKDGLPIWKLPKSSAVIIGACLGILIFSKITVAAPILGIIFAIIFLLILRKKYRELLSFLLFFLLGILAVSLPVFLYFGYHGAIGEMLYCIFSFAFKRSVDFSENFNIIWEIKLSGCIFAFLFACLHRNSLSDAVRIILVGMSAATYLLLHLGNPFIYYFTTAYPSLLFALILLLSVYDPLIIFKNCYQALCLFVLGVCLFYYASCSMDTIRVFLYDRDNPYYSEYYAEAANLATLIPEWERDRVFCFSTDMTWFEANQIMPCYKYQVNLQFFIALDPQIELDIISYLENTPPKWLVVGSSFESDIPNLFALVDQKYECISSNSTGNLYLLIE